MFSVNRGKQSSNNVLVDADDTLLLESPFQVYKTSDIWTKRVGPSDDGSDPGIKLSSHP
jgi:hypothetical protein